MNTTETGIEGVVPLAFICPLSFKIMTDPVVDNEGYSYERSYIELYIEAHNKSPITNNPLLKTNLVINRNLKDSIQEFIDEHRDIRSNEIAYQQTSYYQSQIHDKVASMLGVALTEQDREHINHLFPTPTVSSLSPINIKITAKQCFWFKNVHFRLALYNEFAQLLNPSVSYGCINIDTQNKQDIKHTYMQTITDNPNEENPLSIVQIVLSKLIELYHIDTQKTLEYYRNHSKRSTRLRRFISLYTCI